MQAVRVTQPFTIPPWHASQFRRHCERVVAALFLLLSLGLGIASQAATPATGQLCIGDGFALGLKSDGTVWSWGANGDGQLGDATTGHSFPGAIAGLANVAGLDTGPAAGANHVLAVLNDGTVRAWGGNASGQLGDGTTTSRTTPVTVTSLANVMAVAAGTSFSLAVKSDGTVWSWGTNANGQLGNGSTTKSLVPVQVTGLTSVIAITAGGSSAVALKSDGTVWTWGLNTSGQLGNGTTTQSLVPVQVTGLSSVTAIVSGGAHVLALCSDGTLRAWGLNTYGRLGDGTTTMRKAPVAVSSLTGVVAIGAGASHSLAVKADGTAWAWGLNASGQLGDGTRIDRNTPAAIAFVSPVTAIAGGSALTMVQRNDGSIACFGANERGQFGDGTSTSSYLLPIQSAVWTDLLTVSSGASHSLAVRSDHTLWTWGLNGNGQLGDGTTTSRIAPVAITPLSNVVAVAAGATHSLAALTDGTVRAWGLNSNGQLGDATTTQRAAPVAVSSLTNVSAVAAGTSFSLALKSDGTVWSWGLNTNGQLGNGTTTQSLVPVQVTGLTAVTAISAGTSFALARRSDGTVWSWGDNTKGQLGNGTTIQSLVPVQVTGLTSATAIAAGSVHSLALLSDGTMRSWGQGGNGRLGSGSTPSRSTPGTVPALTQVVSISAGLSHSLALKTDGTAWAWGLNSSGQLGDGTVTDRLVPTAIASAVPVRSLVGGGSQSLAILTDGTLRTWGSNASGQLAAPVFIRSAAALALKIVASDTDADGLPDAWEQTKFGNLSATGTADTDKDGLSNIQEWVLGCEPLQTDVDQDHLTDSVDSVPGDFFNGVAPLLTIVSGTNQSSPINTFNAQPFVVAAWNSAGTIPLVNAPVTFTVTSGSGQLSLRNDGSSPLAATISVRTDSNGTAQAYFRQSATPGASNAISVQAGASAVALSTTTLTSNVAPTITTQPVSSSVPAGASTSFMVVATGSPVPTYQWRKNGTAISGATGATYSIAATAAGDAGSYSVVVTNSAGTATSAGAALTVATAPTNAMVSLGVETVLGDQRATFSVTCDGTAPFTYQWWKAGFSISGATSASYVIAKTTPADTGTYYVQVANAAGSATSNAVTLTVADPPVAPTITTQPVSRTVTAGASAAFTVVAAGSSPLTYQWRKNGAPISGATGASYSIAVTVAGDAGSYVVVITNSAGSVTSANATLTVNFAPTIITQPAGIVVTAGASASFTVVASGSPAPTYQWRKNGTNITGATSPTYSIAATAAGDAGAYSVVVANSIGSVTSSNAPLVLNVAPIITTQPVSTTVTAGASASFTVVATGSPAPTYQWRKDGTAIAGATSSTYTIAATATGDAGTYSVLVANPAATVPSTGAILTVNAVVQNQAPTVALVTPIPLSDIYVGQPVQLSAEASDSDGQVTKVEFFLDTTKLGECLTVPYQLNWVPTRAGATSLKARATDNGGSSTDSVVVLVDCVPTIPHVADFESAEGFTLASVDGQLGWSAQTPVAEVSSTSAKVGSRSLSMRATTTPVTAELDVGSFDYTKHVVFVDFYAKPKAGVDAALGKFVGIDWVKPNGDVDWLGATLVKRSAVGQFALAAPSANATPIWQDVVATVLLDAAAQSSDWVRFTVRLEFGSRYADIYVNGRLCAYGLALPAAAIEELLTLDLRASASSNLSVDRVAISYVHPLFADANDDGIDDAWELANGMTLAGSNRNGNPTGDGHLNIKKWMFGVDPRAYFSGTFPEMPIGVDSDGDGIPDTWERAHGLSPFDPADAALHGDNDGLDNLGEYQAGRDPNDPSDGWPIPDGYQLVLRMPGTPPTFSGVTSDWKITSGIHP